MTKSEINNACSQCPWRLSNQGKRHAGSFYAKANLTRLWNQIRRGGGAQSCHLTDARHPDHIKAGCPETATVRECPGSVVLVLRELKRIGDLSAEVGTLDGQGIESYIEQRRPGLTRRGIGYWAIGRYQFGGTVFGAGPKLPQVNPDDLGIGLPEYLKRGDSDA